MIDVAKLLALQSGLGNGPGDDYTGPNWATGGVTYTRNPQTGKWENPTADDPALQKLIEQGVINGTNVDFGKLPSTVYGQPFGDTTGAGYRQVQVENGRIVDPSGNLNIRFPADVRNDPNYGWITPSTNLSNKDNTLADKVGLYLPSAIAAAMTLGAGAIGAGVPWFVSAGMKALSGGVNFNDPLSVLSTLSPGLNDLGIPSWASTIANVGLAGEGLYSGLQSQKQYQAPVQSTATATSAAQTFTPAGSAVTPNVAAAAPAAQTTTTAAPASTSTPAVQYLPDPESAIPDIYNAAAFGGGGGSQVITDNSSAPVSTSVAPDAYNNSYSQIVS